MTHEHITTNLAPTVRYEEFNGKKYLVVPMVLMTEGVHAGSNGPLFYPRAELAKTPVTWNMKPVVVYHPTRGQTATDPDVARRRQVGIIMNTRWDNGKLRAEAWLERDRLATVDERILTALENDKMLEVSTGVFTDVTYAPGTWNGTEYEYVARNYRADHLAILPDRVGACSIKDGCGLLQTNESEETEMTQTETPLALPTMTFGDEPVENCCCGDAGDEGPLRLPVMNFGETGNRPDTTERGGRGQTPEPTHNHATGGDVATDEGPLPVPVMKF